MNAAGKGRPGDKFNSSPCPVTNSESIPQSSSSPYFPISDNFSSILPINEA